MRLRLLRRPRDNQKSALERILLVIHFRRNQDSKESSIEASDCSSHDSILMAENEEIYIRLEVFCTRKTIKNSERNIVISMS